MKGSRGTSSSSSGQVSLGAGGGGTPSAKGAMTTLPIMDEVNELIEKEKLLLEFKVLEQQKEAHDWKLRYDTLLGKISENVSNSTTAVATAGYQVLEEAAASEEKSAVAVFDEVTSNLADFIHKIGNCYTLDMCGKPAAFVVAQIANGAQVLKRYSTSLKSVYLSHCGLTDDHAALLCAKLVANNATDVIDLSFNHFGVGLETVLFETLLRRKKTPEFIHLQGNMPLAAESSTFHNILGVLSDHTWGVGVTLNDFQPLAFGAAPSGKATKVVKKGDTGRGAGAKAGEDFSGGVRHPMHAHTFLKVREWSCFSCRSVVMSPCHLRCGGVVVW